MSDGACQGLDSSLQFFFLRGVEKCSLIGNWRWWYVLVPATVLNFYQHFFQRGTEAQFAPSLNNPDWRLEVCRQALL